MRATPVNIVSVTPMVETISLEALYELLPIVEVILCHGSGKPSTRDKIPYFGEENIIVSVRYMNKSRGIRNNKGQMRNVVAVDLQHLGKNIHFKVSEDKVTSMGCTSEEMCRSAARLMIEYFKMIHGHWLHIKALNEDVLHKTLEWFYREWRFIPSELPEGIDKRTISYLRTFTHEFKETSEIKEKVERILDLPSGLYEREPDLGDMYIGNSVYNHHLYRDLPLIRLSRELLEKGYGVQYNNSIGSSSKRLYVCVPVVSEDGDGNHVVATKHKFTVHKGGHIQQYSACTQKYAVRMASRLLGDIMGILS